MKSIVLVGLFCLAAFSVSAQKIAFVDAQNIMFLMPEYKTAAAKVDSFQKYSESKLVLMDSTFKEKQAYLQKNFETLSISERELLGEELQDLLKRAQNFSYRSEQELYLYQQEVLQPVNDKLKKAIKEIADEKGYTHVISSAALLYSADESTDITELVMTKLGLEMPDPAAAGGQ